MPPIFAEAAADFCRSAQARHKRLPPERRQSEFLKGTVYLVTVPDSCCDAGAVLAAFCWRSPGADACPFDSKGHAIADVTEKTRKAEITAASFMSIPFATLPPTIGDHPKGNVKPQGD